jgi:hypothetical protein
VKEQSTERVIESRPSWEDVEALARQRIQTWFQRLLEEEVEQLLGRARYARREGIDAPGGYRNGLGKPRRLTLSAGTITVRRPRVRGLAERFESRLLPLFKRRTSTGILRRHPVARDPGLSRGAGRCPEKLCGAYDTRATARATATPRPPAARSAPPGRPRYPGLGPM